MTCDLNLGYSLDLKALQTAYSGDDFHPEDLIIDLYRRLASEDEAVLRACFIHLRPREDLLYEAKTLKARKKRHEHLPLYGVPYVIKDNIDVASLPTTAGCPDFAYIPKNSSPLIERLNEAGALCLGKTNLDQFATGLVGTRTPYGALSSVFHKDYISGGSSSGSAVAVARGFASFALGTDTAGSGRIPAAFNNIVGLKPSRGLLSTRGVVPACRTLDCVSIFALTCMDAAVVSQVLRGYDEKDPYSSDIEEMVAPFQRPFVFGVPFKNQLDFLGDAFASKRFEEACAVLEKCGGRAFEIDFTPFAAVAELLYGGPWVAERLASLENFVKTHPKSLHPVTTQVLSGATRWQATDTFKAFYKLAELKSLTQKVWKQIDVLFLPTAGTHYTIKSVEENPIELNSNLGLYTNFTNLLDLAAIAVPAGFKANGLPFGVSLMAPRASDDALCQLGEAFHKSIGGLLGKTNFKVPDAEKWYDIAVVGAHLRGEPLHHQLTSLGAIFVREDRTAPDYKLYELCGTKPRKPGLVHVPGFNGPGIALEIWSLKASAFAQFTCEVPMPLAIGNVTLEGQDIVKCFVAQPSALLHAKDISEYGGWKSYLQHAT